jgi:hypothetical protein
MLHVCVCVHTTNMTMWYAYNRGLNAEIVYLCVHDLHVCVYVCILQNWQSDTLATGAWMQKLCIYACMTYVYVCILCSWLCDTHITGAWMQKCVCMRAWLTCMCAHYTLDHVIHIQQRHECRNFWAKYGYSRECAIRRWIRECVNPGMRVSGNAESGNAESGNGESGNAWTNIRAFDVYIKTFTLILQPE